MTLDPEEGPHPDYLRWIGRTLVRADATEKGAQFVPSYGANAMKAAMPAVQVNAWQAFEGGKAKVSPDTVGIPKP